MKGLNFAIFSLTSATSTKGVADEVEIASMSSGRSAPPQDPIVMASGGSGFGTMSISSALLEEIAERASGRRRAEEKGEKAENTTEKEMRIAEAEELRRAEQKREEEGRLKAREERVEQLQVEIDNLLQILKAKMD